jgi:hypothetical protein
LQGAENAGQQHQCKPGGDPLGLPVRPHPDENEAASTTATRPSETSCWAEGQDAP